jgi:hypothetical protein
MARCTLSAASEALDVDALGWKRSLYDSDDVVVVGFWDQGGHTQQGVEGESEIRQMSKPEPVSAPRKCNKLISLILSPIAVYPRFNYLTPLRYGPTLGRRGTLELQIDSLPFGRIKIFTRMSTV